MGKSTAITTKGMGTTPDPARDSWLTESYERGHGAFLGRITPKGERIFYFRYTGTTGQVRLPIGRFAPSGDAARTYTVAQARDIAITWSAMHRGGIVDLREHFAAEGAARNLAEELKRQELEAAKRDAAARAEAAKLAAERRLTVRQLFERWALTELKPHARADGSRTGRKDGGAYIRQQFERRVFQRLGDVAAADVKKGDLLAVLDKAKADGKLRTANVLLAALKQMFRFALTRELVERNPLDTVTKRDAGGAEVERDRVLSSGEIKTLATQLPQARMAARTVHAIWIILATGCRVSELMRAEWRQVDLIGRRWYLPTTKNGRDHTIHLSDFACVHFNALTTFGRKADKPNDNGVEKPPTWVFTNTDGDGPLDVKTLAKQVADRQRPSAQRMSQRAKCTDALLLGGERWTPHDLRRTAATTMAQLGISSDVIDECLNHVIESRVRRTYIRDRRPAEQASAFDALGARLASLAGCAPATSEPLQQIAA